MSLINLGTTVALAVSAATTVAWSQLPREAGGRSTDAGTTRRTRPVDDPVKSGAPAQQVKNLFERAYVLTDGEDLKAFKSPARDIRVEREQ